MKNAFYRHAKAAEAELVGFLSEIVAIPSMSSDEGRVIERIRAQMETLGFDEARIDPMGNLIGRVGSGPRSIAFDAHVDTVGVGEADLWKTDPFDPKVRDGWLFGRGTSDMKGGAVSSIYAAALLKKTGLLPDDLTVYMTATVQEEDCDGLCWQFLAREEGLRPDVVVITEPTSLNVYRGQRGRMEIEISTTGLSSHGSAPARGVNAVYKMAEIIRDIERLNLALPPREPLGPGSVTISGIRSTSPSQCAVADSCTISLDRRLTVGETAESSVAELEALPSVRAAGARVEVLEYAVPSHTGLVYPTKKYFPAWQTEVDDPAIQAALAAHRDALETEARLGFWVFSTNGVATAGLEGLTTIGFGPGDEKWAHAPDERIRVEDLVRATAFYMALATRV